MISDDKDVGQRGGRAPGANPFLQGTQQGSNPNVPKKKFQGKAKTKHPSSTAQAGTRSQDKEFPAQFPQGKGGNKPLPFKGKPKVSK